MDQDDLTGNTETEFFFYYTVLDATGNETLSSYTLDATPLTFIPEKSEEWPGEYSNKRNVWDFGDGTPPIETTSAEPYNYAWLQAGSYTVSLTVTSSETYNQSDTYATTITVSENNNCNTDSATSFTST